MPHCSRCGEWISALVYECPACGEKPKLPTPKGLVISEIIEGGVDEVIRKAAKRPPAPQQPAKPPPGPPPAPPPPPRPAAPATPPESTPAVPEADPFAPAPGPSDDAPATITERPVPRPRAAQPRPTITPERRHVIESPPEPEPDVGSKLPDPFDLPDEDEAPA